MGEYVGVRRARPFARYLKVRAARDAETETYRDYVTESIRNAVKGSVLTKSFRELLGEPGKPIDGRTGDEIAESVIGNLGLEVK